jgi:hypothetical protein
VWSLVSTATTRVLCPVAPRPPGTTEPTTGPLAPQRVSPAGAPNLRQRSATAGWAGYRELAGAGGWLGSNTTRPPLTIRSRACSPCITGGPGMGDASRGTLPQIACA